MLRFAVVATIAAGVSFSLHADQMPLTYYYTFTLPTFLNGSPDGGSFTTTITSSPGPIENTTIPEETPGFVVPVLGFSDVTQSPKAGTMFRAALFGNADIRGYMLLGTEYVQEDQGAWLELDYGGPAGFIAFGFSATDAFWRGPGGTFGLTPEGFAVYEASGDPICTTCSVTITSAPEPVSIALLISVLAALGIAGRRRRNLNHEQATLRG